MFAFNLTGAGCSRSARDRIKKLGVLRKVSTTVVFPAPDGAEMTNRIPCRLNGLLKILNLFADLLQVGIASDHALRDCRVIRLRSECVEFAKNLLRDEFQCASDRLLAAQMMGKLSEMTLQSRQLLRYIRAIGEEGYFL